MQDEFCHAPNKIQEKEKHHEFLEKKNMYICISICWIKMEKKDSVISLKEVNIGRNVPSNIVRLCEHVSSDPSNQSF